MTPEDKVKKSCLSRLEVWKMKGVVVDYDDVSNLGRKATRYGYVMHTKKGKRDVIVLFKHEGMIWVYLVECKRPDGGVWGKDQQDYCMKFQGINNVIYEVVKHPGQIDATIERITGFSQKQLDSIVF